MASLLRQVEGGHSKQGTEGDVVKGGCDVEVGGRGVSEQMRCVTCEVKDGVTTSIEKQCSQALSQYKIFLTVVCVFTLDKTF